MRLLKANGFSLILVVIIGLLLFTAVSGSYYISAKHLQITKTAKQKLQGQIIAESGLAKGLWLIKNQSGFFTDPDYEGPTANTKSWLLSSTSGLTEANNNGHYKIVKEQTKNRLFCIGYLGDNPNNRPLARKVLQQNYTIAGGIIQKTNWQQL
ncbi:hypothetical protein ACFL4D_02050 [Candidatus Margulisiibacteriota bacterium]